MIKRFIKEIAIFMLVSGISRLLPFLLIPLFTHYIEPADMGRLELILSAYNILTIFGICQIDTALQRYYYTGQSFSKAALHVVIKQSLIVLGVSLLLLPLITTWYLKNMRGELLIALVSMFFNNVFIINGLIIRYSKKITMTVVANVLQTILFAAFAYYFVVKENAGVKGYLLATLVSNFVSCLISWLIIKDEITTTTYKNEKKILLAFAIPQLPARIASVIAQFGNRFLLLWLFNQSVVGLFSIANKISSLVLVALTAFTMVWYPMLYSNKQSDYHEVRKIFKLVIALLALAMPIALVLVGFVFEYYIDRAYADAKYASMILLIAMSFLIIKEMVDAGIKISGKVKFISYIYIANTFLLFVLMLVLGKTLGMNGIAYAILLANMSLVIITWFVSKRCYQIDFSSVYMYAYITYSLLLVSIGRYYF